MKFKVGDKVKIKFAFSSYCMGIYRNKVGLVTEIDGDIIFVEYPGLDNEGHYAWRFDYVIEKKPQGHPLTKVFK